MHVPEHCEQVIMANVSEWKLSKSHPRTIPSHTIVNYMMGVLLILASHFRWIGGTRIIGRHCVGKKMDFFCLILILIRKLAKGILGIFGVSGKLSFHQREDNSECYKPTCVSFSADSRSAAAFLVLAAIAKSVGMRSLEKSLEKLDDVRQKKLSKLNGGSRGGTSIVAGLAVPASGGAVSADASYGGFVKRSAASMWGGKRPLPAVVLHRLLLAKT